MALEAGDSPSAGEGPTLDEQPAEADVLTERDLYKILGVRPGAGGEDIRKAYKKKSLRYHPDKNRDDPDAKLKFQRISEAFSVLSDKKKRLQYDKSGDMDLEDFDIDQFMNMWVGEMMEEGGMVDDMMKEVLPWKDEQDKMAQFMELHVKKKGKKWVCDIDGKELSSQRLMMAHFEKSFKYECEAWAKEQVDSMKASFESFMKQITGIGDESGKFVLPDGSTADMSKVKGVPDIRSHFQGKIDKSLKEEKVLDMYRKVAPDESTFVPEVKDIMELLGLEEHVALELQRDKKRLLKRLKRKIDSFHDEEEDELAMLNSMGGMGGMGGMGMGSMDGLDGLDGLGGLEQLLGGAGGLEQFLGGLDPHDPAAMEVLLAKLSSPDAGLGGLGGFAGLGGLRPPPGPPRPARDPASSAAAAADVSALAALPVGSTVRVIAGRNFEKFRGGMRGTIRKNSADDRNMQVQFDDVATAGAEPVQVAYRHLELA